MTCALCLREEQLKFSHIIPEFLYKSLYDDKHRFHVISSKPDSKNALWQKRTREYLLCDDCETHLSKYEDYGSQILNGGIELEVRQEKSILFISGIDYKRFKLFQLSILWRAGVSTLPMFSKVELGPHEEEMRKMVLDDDPGPALKYPCITWLITLGPRASDGLIMQPTKTRVVNQRGYKFMFGGILWSYVVSKDPPAHPLALCILNEKGETIMQLKHVSEMRDLVEFMKSVDDQDKNPLKTREPYK